MKRLCVLILFFVFISPVFPQKIIKIQRPIVLIDTDQNIGKIGDVLLVQRILADFILDIGKIKILKFDNSQTAAQIMSEVQGYSISIGDVVRTSKISNGKESISPQKKHLPTYNFLIGISSGALIPLGTMSNGHTPSFKFGLNFGYYTDTFLNLFGEIDVSSLNGDAKLYWIGLALRLKMNQKIHLDILGGVYGSSVGATYLGNPGNKADGFFGIGIGPSIRLIDLKIINIFITSRLNIYGFRALDNLINFLNVDIEFYLKL